MSDLEILARLFLALGFGAILGLETETREEGESDATHESRMRRKLGGVRTYTVLSLFGAVAGLLYTQGQVIFAYLVFLAVFMIVLAAYIFNVRFNKAFGMTTEIAIMITVLIGFAATSGIIALQILVVLIVVLTFILSQKRGIALIVRRIAHEELTDIVKFAIVALVIFPFLPNQDFRLIDFPLLQSVASGLNLSAEVTNQLVLLNPFKMWQYVVLISGFSLLGYFANRAWGQRRGLLLTGVLSGFVSSTSATITLAIKSKQQPPPPANSISGAALLGNAVSFLQMGVLAATASVLFFNATLPVLLTLGLVSAAVGLVFLLNSKADNTHVKLDYVPFSLAPALQFALMLTVLRVLVQLVQIYAGDGAFIVVTALSGMLGMDLSTITLGELVARQEIGLTVAVITFLGANGVNYLAKFLYANWQGSPSFSLKLGAGLAVSFVFGLGVMFLLVA